ncbi:ABC transporter substrate-binding protein [Microbacterium excoecariae]|uniref:ABC transporter substrate-binding protein n=1 Tax=Microbacterium excoecariae TaxID=2715210 RepID=UPI00140BB2B1|nr:extracellular solute-binding protein [Microbacterium excoecariae]NHI15689.1 extracellular solute-binding protein [Microbacterium excoecariae]
MFRTTTLFAAAAVTVAGGLVLTSCSSGSGGGDGFDPEEEITLTFTFWGNDVRADLYDQAFDAFTEEYPNITINSSFLDFPAYWEKRQTEAAGGGLPDVMQFDYSYLRQYAENGLLLDLAPYVGEEIDDSALSEEILAIGEVAGGNYGITTSTNAWGLFSNPKLLDTVGVEDFAGGTYDEYTQWIADATATAHENGHEVWGASDWTGRIQLFELQQRAMGEDLFTEDGEPNFTEDDLRAFWEQGSAIREEGAFPAAKAEEVYPLGGFDTAQVLSEGTWDNFGAGYLGNLGGDYTELTLQAPPIVEEGAQDLYLKPSMLHSVAATTDHPEASALLVDFLVNSPESGEIFGTNRGLPASDTALEAAELDELSQQVRDYEASIADRLGDAPPVPIVGYGTLEEKFRQLGQELGYGTVTVDEAVDQFFSEMDVILN